MQEHCVFARLTVLSVLLLLPCRQGAAEDTPPEKEIEVHAVGIYEGATETGNRIHGPKAAVEVNRPDKSVILLLSCYGPVTWEITAREETELRKVYLIGRPPQAVKGLKDESIVVKTWETDKRDPSYAGHDSNAASFYYFVQWATKLTGQDRLASFTGTYRPASPFTIHLLQADRKLRASYPELTPVAELPEKAQKLKFKAVRYLESGRRGRPSIGAYGDFTLQGPQEDTLRPLPDRVSRIAYDLVDDQYYGISGHDVVKIDLKKQEVETMELGLDVPPLSWPCEITFDSKRRRIILGSSGGGGYLYAYSPEQQEWSVISRRPGALDAFSYSEQEDCIYGVLFERFGERSGVFLAKVNALGAIIWKMRLEDPVIPGSLATGPGPSSTRVAAVADYVAIMAKGRPVGDTATSYIYLVEPQTKRIWVTSKSETEAQGRPGDNSRFRSLRRR